MNRSVKPRVALNSLNKSRMAAWTDTSSADVGSSAIGMIDVLSGQRILDLGSGDRDPVEEEAQVDGLVRAGFVRELAGDGQPVGGVPSGHERVEPRGGPEVGESELGLLMSGIDQPIDLQRT